MGGIRRYKSIISSLLIIMIGVSWFQLTPISLAASSSDTKTVTIENVLSEKYSSSATKSISKNVSSYVPDGYQVDSFEIIKSAAAGNNKTKEVNQGTYGGSIYNNVITIPTFNGVEIEVENVGYTSKMYFGVVRTNNGKQWQITSGKTGKVYTVSPTLDSDCWQNNIAACPGELDEDINGKTLPSDIKNSDGWGVMISDGFDGPTKYYYEESQDNDEVSFSQLKNDSVKIKSAIPDNDDYVKVSFSVDDNIADLTAYVDMSYSNKGYSPEAYGSSLGTVNKYNVNTTTSWAAKTYLYEADIVLNLIPIPATDEPYVSCDCEASPSSIEFADADVAVKSTLTATVKNNESRTVKNWTVYGRANDGSQLITKTSLGSGQSSVSASFSFTISKALLSNVDSYTETWVMRARVYFTDGTTAEQAIECTTTVYKPGAATPEPSPSEEPEASPEPTPDPPRIAEAEIEFDPDWIIAGEKSSLLNTSKEYDDYEWEFSDNLSDVIPDADKKKFEDIQFDEPGTYKAKLNVWNDEGSEDSASAVLEVVDPKPVAVVTGPVKIIQGREFPYLHNLLNSYTPLESRGESIDFTKSEYRYKNNEDSDYTIGWPTKGPDEIGTYSIEGKVYDTTGRESDWGTLQLQVVPDETPTVSLIAPETAYRNGEQTIFIDGDSPDGDQLVQLIVQERYDDDDDGNFDEEPWTSIYNGAYKSSVSVKYTTVGSRQYRAQVTEDYGLVSNWSELDETEILNYAPEVDFDAYGLTTQPEEDSLPPTTTLTPFSVYNSWQLKTPYTGGDASKLAWKTDDTYLSTKNAQYPNYYVDYPNTGLGANSRSAFDLASDLYAATPWAVPSGETLYQQVFGVNRIYTYISASTGSTVNERDSVTGELLRTFTIPGSISLIDPQEQFYSVTKDSSTRTMTFKVYNNEGEQIDSFSLSYASSLDSSKTIGATISDYKFSDDGSILYLTLEYYYSSTYYLYQMRYSLDTRTITWDVPISAKINYDDYSFGNVKMTLADDGAIYSTYRKESWEEGYLHESYLVWVTPAGVKTLIDIGGDGASYPVVSNDGVYVYVNTMDLTKNDRNHYMLTYNLSTGKKVSTYTLADEASGWKSEMTEQVINPAILTTGNVLSVDLLSKDGSTLAKSYADIPNFQTLMGKVFLDSAGRAIIPRSEYFSTSGEIQTYIDVYTNGSLTKTYKNPFVSSKGYTESNAPSDTTISSYAATSTSILPDGSIYMFARGYVIPYVGASAPADYPKEIDDDTIEVIDDTWGGLWYDPYTTQKNGAISFNVKIDSTDSSDMPIGAAIEIQDEKNLYSVEWTDTKLTLYKVVSGTKTSLKSTSLTRLAGTTYAFKLEAQNGTLNVYVNNIKKLTASDSKFSSGSLGLMAIGQEQAKFSGITITNYGDTYTEKTAQTVLVNEEIEYDTVFSDLESDSKYAEKWTYEHDPDYFANPEGTSSYDNKTYSSPLESLDKPGLYEITYQAQDNPGLAAYQEWSEGVTKELYVHRRPIADPDVRLTGIVYADGEALDYDTYDASYDPDVPDYLAKRSFRYRWADASDWTDGQLLLYNRPGIELIIQEQVKDIHGAWSYWAETRVYEDELPAVNQTKPVMTITAPSGTSSSPTVYLTDPTLKWTYYDKENDPQEMFYLKLTYVDTGETIMEVTYPGNDTSFILEEGTIEKSRKVKVMGRVYSNNAWSADSNVTYFILNTPPVTTLLSFNGPDAENPVYTQSKTPTLQVKVTDAEGHTPKYIDYEVYYNSTGELEVDTNSTTSATSYTPAALKEGLHVWKARAYDGYEWGEFSEKGYFFVDSVKPRDTEEVLQISPTSVTVTFNPFSDPDPSSGHASRGFYMQKVNADGSVSAIDLNGNGTAESSIALAKTATSYTVNGLTSGQKYRLMVNDYDVAGNEGNYEYIYFVTNQAPVADFDWSPKPVYEGDDISLINLSADPDGDDLTYVWTVTGPDGYYSQTFTSENVTMPGTVTVDHAGSYTVRLHVEDVYGLANEEDAVKTITVLPLGITATVTHTEDWEQNRLKWNEKTPDDTRSSSMFWAGERFVLNAWATDTGTSSTKANKVTVTAAKVGQTLLSSTDKVEWTGYLGNENAEVKLETLTDGSYVFNFKVLYSNGVEKETDVTIYIKGKWTDYFRFHKLW